MATRFDSRTWSSATLARGFCIANQQQLDISGVDGAIDADLAAMEQELDLLEAWGVR